ncbi:rRNA (cytosine-C(5))-methyltransferase nop2c [Ranunculus cassubicifolius]
MDSSEKRYSYNPKLKWNPKVEEYFIKAYGPDHFTRICNALTRPSCYSCIRVNTLKTTSDYVIEKLVSILQDVELRKVDNGGSMDQSNFSGGAEMCSQQLSSRKGLDDLSDNQETVIGSLGNGDARRASVHNVPITKCQVPGLDYVVFVEGSGPHVIEYGDAADNPPKEVIVSRKCAEAVLRGAQVFVPGVLACSGHVEVGDTVAVSVSVEQPGSEGKWGVGITRGTTLQGSQADPHYFERHGLYIGQGIAKLSRAGIFRAPEGIAVEMIKRVFDLPSFHSLLEGEIFLQNLPSIVTAHALDPQQGERILDMCAAPGGKTTAVAILMRDKGDIIATDRSHNKVLDIKKLVAEMDLSCITAVRLDALKSVSQKTESTELATEQCNKEILGATADSTSVSQIPGTDVSSVAIKQSHLNGTNEGADQGKYLSKKEIRKNMRMLKNGPGRSHSTGGRVEKHKGFLPSSFDRILLDAPCSALGLRPRLFSGEETIESLRKHANYQRKMFDQAVQLVRPGGIIVYSTCTINPGENEALVRYALDKYKFLSLAPQNPRVGGPGLVGGCELFDGEISEEWLRPGEEKLVQRFDPSSSLDTIGFFIAKFEVGQKDNY